MLFACFGLPETETSFRSAVSPATPDNFFPFFKKRILSHLFLEKSVFLLLRHCNIISTIALSSGSSGVPKHLTFSESRPAKRRRVAPTPTSPQSVTTPSSPPTTYIPLSFSPTLDHPSSLFPPSVPQLQTFQPFSEFWPGADTDSFLPSLPDYPEERGEDAELEESLGDVAHFPTIFQSFLHSSSSRPSSPVSSHSHAPVSFPSSTTLWESAGYGDEEEAELRPVVIVNRREAEGEEGAAAGGKEKEKRRKRKRGEEEKKAKDPAETEEEAQARAKELKETAGIELDPFRVRPAPIFLLAFTSHTMQPLEPSRRREICVFAFERMGLRNKLLISRMLQVRVSPSLAPPPISPSDPGPPRRGWKTAP